MESIYNKNLKEIQSLFNDELNKQRIKYENKLIAMENILSELDNKYAPKKKNIINRIKERFNKRKSK